jgi:hypothetical protein
MRAVVFSGPSLTPAPMVAGVECRPPVRQGDVYRAALSRPNIIGIIDGYFEVTPTVWHKEILWAMSEGIHVYGAASIGALRAAELEVFGMVGVGCIFEMYRDGLLQDDDEVAVLHGPAELGYPALTEAMVNVRATLQNAVNYGVVKPAFAARLIEAGKRLFYKERTVASILAAGASDGLNSTQLSALAVWLAQAKVDQKSIDASKLMDAICASLARDPSPHQPVFKLSVTSAWIDALKGMRSGGIRSG